MQIQLSDLIDRYTILKLKIERLSNDQKQNELMLNEEFELYETEINATENIKQEWIDKLYVINAACWNLEADIRQGNEDKLGLEEVGRRALKIREINKERIKIKNTITEEIKTGFKEIKINHLSE